MQPHLNTQIQHNPLVPEWRWVGICRCGTYYHAPTRTQLDTKLRSHYTRCTKLHVQLVNGELTWIIKPKAR
jgi:hypothetical protein